MSVQKLLFVTLCRVQSISLDDNIKLKVQIKSKDKQNRISSVYAIKNGIANFYRQTFQLPVFKEGFQFVVINAQTKQPICQLSIDVNFIKNIGTRNNTFQCSCPQIKIIWQAVIKRDSNEEMSQITQRNLFDTGELQNGKNDLIEDLQPAKKIREKRKKSFKAKKNQDAISEPQDLTQNAIQLTNDTLELKKLCSLLEKTPRINYISTERNHYLQKDESRMIQRSSNNKFNDYLQKVQKDKNGHQKVKYILNQAQKVSNTKQEQSFKPQRLLSPKMNKLIKHEQLNCLKRSKSGGLLSRISLRDVLSTALVGIISGITAAQF